MIKYRPEIKSRRGFTMIELVVSIALSSMVFILVGSFMAFVVNKNSRNQRSELFEQTKNDLARDFNNSIQWAEHINITGAGIVADGVSYVFSDGTIRKNGKVLIPDEVTVNSFEVKNYSVSDELVSVEIVVQMQSAAYPLSKDELKLVISQRLTEVESE